MLCFAFWTEIVIFKKSDWGCLSGTVFVLGAALRLSHLEAGTELSGEGRENRWQSQRRGGRGEHITEIRTRLVYTASSRSVRVTRLDPVSQHKLKPTRVKLGIPSPALWLCLV